MKTTFSNFINEFLEDYRKLKYSMNLPINNPIFIDAINNTEGVTLTNDGLEINAIRYQKSIQGGELSVRTGIFYLPLKDKNAKYYKNAKYGYGGTDKFIGTIIVKNPIFIKGATGGKAPENAYDMIKGKGSHKKMVDDVFSIISGFYKKVLPEDIAEILTKYNDDDYDYNYDFAYYILKHSNVGNTLRYAIQENIIAHAVRDAGYDCVLGYSKRRDDTYFISEIFDVREITYPSHNKPSDIHKSFLE